SLGGSVILPETLPFLAAKGVGLIHTPVAHFEKTHRWRRRRLPFDWRAHVRLQPAHSTHSLLELRDDFRRHGLARHHRHRFLNGALRIRGDEVEKYGPPRLGQGDT